MNTKGETMAPGASRIRLRVLHMPTLMRELTALLPLRDSTHPWAGTRKSQVLAYHSHRRSTEILSRMLGSVEEAVITVVSLFMVLTLVICLAAPAHAAQVTLAWDAPTTGDAPTGYKIYYGLASGSYNTVIDVGNVLTYILTGLDSMTIYYSAATAYNADEESDFSNEVILDFQGVPNPPAPVLVTWAKKRWRFRR
jgi:hypothetical protein